MKTVQGGVCAPKGFLAGGFYAGIKDSSKKDDIALIVSECECAAACVYTSNKVKAAPLYVTMEHLESETAQAIIVNSGNANACAPSGMENARKMCALAAKELGLETTDVLVASTGVIGQSLSPVMGKIEAALAGAAKALSKDGSPIAAKAIMTTDLIEKEIAVSFEIGGKACVLGGIAKGSGMIEPNMGTMLAFLTTDCAITPQMLDTVLRDVTRRTFNRISVDGDTSTNDVCAILANGLAQNEQIEWQDEDYDAFAAAMTFVCEHLARAIAKDGEGATKLLTCTVSSSRSEEAAEKIAKAVISSSLVKTAMFGADANWGRVICAMGYSKAPFRPEYVDISFASAAGEILVCENGSGLSFDEALAKKVLTEAEVDIGIDVKEGAESATCWGCDLTYDYVKINGDYRT